MKLNSHLFVKESEWEQLEILSNAIKHWLYTIKQNVPSNRRGNSDHHSTCAI